MSLEDVILECATDPTATPFGVSKRLCLAGAADWAAYELLDRKMWVRMGADWALLSDLAESVA